MKKTLDLIIFGATGFTGRYVVERLAQTVEKYHLPLKWGIAVRNPGKMQQYLSDIEGRTGIRDLKSRVALLEADVERADTMRRAFGQGSLVLNCIGPYSLLGEPVVQACIDSKSHYMDLSGEPKFLESIQLKYNRAAQDTGVYVVGSCGFDSIPADVGTQYLKHKFPGHLNQVEHFLEIWYNKANNFSYATWIALIEGYKHAEELKRLRRELFAQNGQFYKPYKWNVVQKRHLLAKSPRGYIVPFPGSDRSVVKRTQLYRYTMYGEPPTQLEAYYCIHDLSTLLKSAIMNYNLTLGTKFPFMEKILREHGDFFSLGTFRKGKMPNREQLKENRFRLSLVGRGWPQDIPESERRESNMSRRSAVIISGGDGAYTETATIAIQTALVLLEQIQAQRQNRTIPFGVITPGTIVEPELLLPRLVKEGIKVEFIEDYHD